MTNFFWLRITTPRTRLSEKFLKATVPASVLQSWPSRSSVSRESLESWDQTTVPTFKVTTGSSRRSMDSIAWQVPPTTCVVTVLLKAKLKSWKELWKKQRCPIQTCTWPYHASEQLRLTTNYHLRRSCYLEGKYKTIYPEISKVTKPVMTLSNDCKIGRPNRNITMISTPQLYPVWYKENVWPFRTPGHWNGIELWY